MDECRQFLLHWLVNPTIDSQKKQTINFLLAKLDDGHISQNFNNNGESAINMATLGMQSSVTPPRRYSSSVSHSSGCSSASSSPQSWKLVNGVHASRGSSLSSSSTVSDDSGFGCGVATSNCAVNTAAVAPGDWSSTNWNYPSSSGYSSSASCSSSRALTPPSASDSFWFPSTSQISQPCLPPLSAQHSLPATPFKAAEIQANLSLNKQICNDSTLVKVRRSLSLTPLNQAYSNLGVPLSLMTTMPPTVSVNSNSTDSYAHCHAGFHSGNGISRYPYAPSLMRSHTDIIMPTSTRSDNLLAFLPGRNTFLEPGSGMRDVPGWLKLLRLHKYAPLFAQLSYDQMIKLDEAKLEKWGVTKGARRKMVLSINKLIERHSLLCQLERDLADGTASLITTTQELKIMIQSPIKPPSCIDEDVFLPSLEGLNSPSDQMSEGNIPAYFTRVLSKVFEQLSSNVSFEDECFENFLFIADRCINHEAFGTLQKHYIKNWKDRILQIWNRPLRLKRNFLPNFNIRNGVCGRPSLNYLCSRNSSPILSVSENIKPTYGTLPPHSQVTATQPSTHLTDSFEYFKTSKTLNAANDVNVPTSEFNSVGQQQHLPPFYNGVTAPSVVLPLGFKDQFQAHSSMQKTLSIPVSTPIGFGNSALNNSGICLPPLASCFNGIGDCDLDILCRSMAEAALSGIETPHGCGTPNVFA